MLERFKEFWAGTVLHPFVRLFIRMGISPDAVTLVGTLGVSAGALIFFPQVSCSSASCSSRRSCSAT